MLELANATIAHRRQTVFEQASLRLNRGRIIGLVAPNGFGKSTLMRVLSGDMRALKRGAVVIDGARHQSDFTSSQVLYVPGDGSMLHHELTPREHLRIAARLWNTSTSPDEAIERCGIADFARKPVRALSQGMKQQTTLALAYLIRAPYLLFDEPLNGLDPLRTEQAYGIFRELAQAGRGLLISSHILESIDELCDAVALVNDGKLVIGPSGVAAKQLFSAYYGNRAS